MTEYNLPTLNPAFEKPGVQLSFWVELNVSFSFIITDQNNSNSSQSKVSFCHQYLFAL